MRKENHTLTSLQERNTLAYAQQKDASDTIHFYRNQFYIPQTDQGNSKIYFCGNSLGCQPKGTSALIDEILQTWKCIGVDGHFEGKNPWISYHEELNKHMARIVGALPVETTLMNTLTVNLHLMMVSFYRPNKQRIKILVEGDAFPSDIYAIESHLRFRGLDPDSVLIKLYPEKGEVLLSKQRILDEIKEVGEELSLIMMGGVNYYTGQHYDLASITDAGHKVGAVVGFDLAHAVGNVPLSLHDWNVDFAVWCTYKYLNSGPGGISGVFIHEKYATNAELSRFAGWWGHDKESRFDMEYQFKPIAGAEGWQLSNIPILLLASLKASLNMFEEVGMNTLREKSKALTAYLYELVNQLERVRILTPFLDEERGCQLSISIPGKGKAVFRQLIKNGVVCDWREPDVIRVAPVPLYNTFEEVWRFAQLLEELISE